MSILDLHPELDELETRWMRSGYADFLRETDREVQATELEERWGEWSAFEEMCRNEVRTRETTFGPESPDLATSLERLADSCLFQKNYDEAEKHYLRALSIREAALGRDDSTIPASLTGLAGIYRFREQYALAEELVQRAAGIYHVTNSR
jgi:tetratricopeptide (TPR) repeat protein